MAEGSGCIISYSSLFSSKKEAKKLNTATTKKTTIPQKKLNVKKIKSNMKIIKTAKMIKKLPIYSSNDLINVSGVPQRLHL